MGSEVHLRELSREELRVIEHLYHRTPDSTIRTRCHILLLSAQDYSVYQIAQLLFSCTDTVFCCIDDFNRAGLDATLTLPHFYDVGAFGRDYSLDREG
jgi:Winged helix-turn helix